MYPKEVEINAETVHEEFGGGEEGIEYGLLTKYSIDACQLTESSRELERMRQSLNLVGGWLPVPHQPSHSQLSGEMGIFIDSMFLLSELKLFI